MKKFKLIVENDELEIDLNGTIAELAEVLMAAQLKSKTFKMAVLLSVGALAEGVSGDKNLAQAIADHINSHPVDGILESKKETNNGEQ